MEHCKLQVHLVFTYGHQVFDLLGGPKIGKLDEACAIDQDVGTLDVPVYDFVVV